MYLVLQYALVEAYLERRAATWSSGFVEADPYVRHDLVTGWTIRDWNVVVG